MAALRKVSEAKLQTLCGDAVAELLLLTAARTPSPNDKLVRNVCAMACGDPAHVPSAAAAAIAAGQCKAHTTPPVSQCLTLNFIKPVISYEQPRVLFGAPGANDACTQWI